MTHRGNTAKLPYYTVEDIAALSDEMLAATQDEVQHSAWFASQCRNGNAYRRATYILERLIYPEVDRRRCGRR